MHYAIVTETYPPEINGVALTVQSLEAGLRALGRQVSLIRPRQARGEAAGSAQTLVAGIPLPGYATLRAGLPLAGQIDRNWRRDRPDAVYIATEGPLGWAALRAARRLGIPVATGFHTRFDMYMREYRVPWMEPVALAWLRRFHNGADAILVPTRELQASLHARRFRRVRVLSRAVDTELFDPVRRNSALRCRLGMDAESPLLIHVGRLAPEKNLRLAVRAFRQLQARCPGARMVWVGDGPLRMRLEREHPDHLFMGILRGQALASVLASADLFVFPSLSETFGNVTLESMASGVPVVAYDYGAAREHLCDGVHGAAIACHDETSFIAATAALGADRRGLVEMGRAARAAVAGLSPRQVAADFDRLLASLADRRRPHADVAA